MCSRSHQQQQIVAVGHRSRHHPPKNLQKTFNQPTQNQRKQRTRDSTAQVRSHPFPYYPSNLLAPSINHFTRCSNSLGCCAVKVIRGTILDTGERAPKWDERDCCCVVVALAHMALSDPPASNAKRDKLAVTVNYQCIEGYQISSMAMVRKECPSRRTHFCCNKTFIQFPNNCSPSRSSLGLGWGGVGELERE